MRVRLAPLAGLALANAFLAPLALADLTVPQCVTGQPWLGIPWPGPCDPQVGDGAGVGDAPSGSPGSPLGPGWWNGELDDAVDQDTFLLAPYKPGPASRYQILVRTHDPGCVHVELQLETGAVSSGDACPGADFRRGILGTHVAQITVSAGPGVYFVVYE